MIFFCDSHQCRQLQKTQEALEVQAALLDQLAPSKSNKKNIENKPSLAQNLSWNPKNKKEKEEKKKKNSPENNEVIVRDALVRGITLASHWLFSYPIISENSCAHLDQFTENTLHMSSNALALR